jgi:hypothetical protein
MSIKVEYDKSQKMWVATYVDEIGPIGHPFVDETRDAAVFGLGVMYGHKPSKYSRPLSEFLDRQK